MPQYEEAAKALDYEVRARRQQYHSDVFGIPENASPSATPADRNSAAMSYRDALYRLQDATPEDLDKAATMAEGTGDMALLRAVGFIADQHGDKATTYRYLQRAGQSVQERYTARNMLPTETTIGSLISAFEPPRIARGALAPSNLVLEARRRQRTAQATRDAGIFRR